MVKIRESKGFEDSIFNSDNYSKAASPLADIEKLVQITAKSALEKDTPIQSRIDALRAIGPYYAALKKAAGQETPESDEPTMEDMRSQIEQENGNGRNVQARTRSRGN